VDAALRHGLHYRGTTMDGAVFYMLGALEIGRVGVVAIDRTRAEATRRYEQIVKILDHESGRR
jgi:hypothetical protein